MRRRRRGHIRPAGATAREEEATPSPAEIVDAIIERSIVLSFARSGPALRRRLFHWAPPAPLDGRVVAITGATSGIGREIARGAASLGARLCLLARSADTGAATAAAIRGEFPGIEVERVVADLSERVSVHRAAQEIGVRHGHIDVLVHNAGLLSRRYRTTVEGIELTTAVHLVGPFLLTGLLLPLLEAAPDAARVVTMSSGGMYARRLDVGRVPPPAAGFDGRAAYAMAKRAQVVLAGEWARRIAPDRVVFHAMHPGWVDTPGLAAGLPLFHRLMRPVLRSPAEGADTALWLCGAHEGGRADAPFWLDRAPRRYHVVPWTHAAPGEAERLWERLEALSEWSLAEHRG